MWIKKVRLKNFLHHEDFEVGLSPGLTCIVGPNGSGKSSIICAIHYALSGDMPGRNKEEAVRWNAEGPAYVELEADHNGQPLKIKRHVDRSRVTLEYAGDRASGAKAVNGSLLELLGLDKDFLSDWVVAREGDLARVLAETPARRREALQSLFGTAMCEKKRDALREHLSRVAAMQMRPETTGQALVDQLAAAEAELNSMDARAVDLQAILEQKNPEKLHTAYVSAKALLDELHHPVSGLAAMQRQAQDRGDRIAKLQKFFDSAKSDLERAREEVLSAQAARQEAETAYRTAAERASAEEEMRKSAAEAADRMRRRAQVEKDYSAAYSAWQEKHAAVPAPPDPQDIEDNDALCRSAWAELQEATRFCEALDVGGSGECPSCGTVTVVKKTGEQHSLLEMVEDAKACARDAKTAYDNANRELAVLRGKQSAHEAAVKDAEQAAATCHNIYSLLEQLPPEDVPELPETSALLEARAVAAKTLESAQERERAANAEQERMTATVHTTEVQIASLRSEEQSLQERIEALRAKGDPGDVQALKQQADEAARLQAEYQQLTGAMQGLRAKVRDLVDRLNRVREIEQQNAAISQYTGDLQAVIDILHRDNYPAAVARSGYARINSAWNALLEELAVPFTARLSLSDDSVMVASAEGELPFAQKSRGERSAIALTFQLAVSRVFSRMGLSIFDEPTDGLDEARLGAVADMLGRVARHAEGAGTQVIVVTHERRLAVAGRVVELAASS